MVRSLWFLVLFVLVAALAVCAPRVAVFAIEGHCLIVPGASIGQLRLGMTLAEATAILGTGGEHRRTGPDASLVFFFNGRLGLTLQGPVVVGITIHDSAENRLCRTADGIGIGSSIAALDEHLGKPDAESVLPGGVTVIRVYRTLGLFIQLTRGEVFGIGVLERRP